jgi:membrane-associated protease RseP (regulator of RpoE activity)
VRFDVLKSGHIVVSAKINGMGPYRLLFDTGAPLSVLSTKAAKDAGVLPKDSQPGRGPLLTAGQHPIQKLQLGGLSAEKVPVLVMDHPAVAALAKEGQPLEGILGFPFFARYRMTLDYQAKTLTLLPGSYEPADVLKALLAVLDQPPKPMPRILAPAALWGFSVRKEKGDDEAGVTIDKVLAGSPAAAAGLQAGDRLLTLDGRWTDSVADCYEAAAAVKAGTAVPVVVRRDGRERTLTVTPRPGL